MSGIIKTLKTKTDDIEQNVYPRTVLEAVVDPDTGKTLDVLLDENMPEGVVYTNDESEPETNVDAVTSASYVSYSNTDSGLEATNVQDAVDEIKESVGEYIAENLIAYPYFNTTSTVDGVTFTDNRDGTITANGTATGSFSGFTCRLYNETLTGRQLTLSKGTYTLSGCPSGGSEGLYFLQVGRTDPTTGSWQTVATDTGEGTTFTITEDMQVSVTIAIIGGTTVNNLVFKPMLEVGTVAHEYKPYSLNRLTKGDIVDNLLSNRADLPVSANQVRLVNEKFSNGRCYCYHKGLGSGQLITLKDQKSNGFSYPNCIIYVSVIGPSGANGIYQVTSTSSYGFTATVKGSYHELRTYTNDASRKCVEVKTTTASASVLILSESPLEIV